MMGAHGVDLFFVISGFCLAYPYLARLRASGSLVLDGPKYIARRLVRIVPPYYAAIVVFAIIFSALKLHAPGLSPLALAQQFLFLDRDQTYLSGAFWTLAVELRWYVAFPFLLWLYARAPRAFALLGIASYGLFYFTRVDAVDFGTMPAFMLGIWAADLHVTGSRLQRFAGAVGIPCAIAAFALVSGQQYYAVQPVGVVAAFAFVVAAGSSEPLRRALSARFLVMLGAASYSIYLFHEPVIVYVELIRKASVLLSICASLGLSLVFYTLFERPFVAGRLRNRLTALAERGTSRFITFLVAQAPAPGTLSSESPSALNEGVSTHEQATLGRTAGASP
jgi:peptidoglycan/LPS O-acetylase OafA/YrhL